MRPGAPHRGQPMRDDDRGAVVHERLQGLLHGLLAHRVEVRGRLVEHEDRRVLEERAGDRDPLALAPTGEAHSPAHPPGCRDPRAEPPRSPRARPAPPPGPPTPGPASGRATRTFARRVSLKSQVSWLTRAMRARRSSRRHSRRSCPARRTVPRARDRRTGAGGGRRSSCPRPDGPRRGRCAFPAGHVEGDLAKRPVRPGRGTGSSHFLHREPHASSGRTSGARRTVPPEPPRRRCPGAPIRRSTGAALPGPLPPLPGRSAGRPAPSGPSPGLPGPSRTASIPGPSRTVTGSRCTAYSRRVAPSVSESWRPMYAISDTGRNEAIAMSARRGKQGRIEPPGGHEPRPGHHDREPAEPGSRSRAPRSGG